jgi:hypothetical protein
MVVAALMLLAAPSASTAGCPAGQEESWNAFPAEERPSPELHESTRKARSAFSPPSIYPMIAVPLANGNVCLLAVDREAETPRSALPPEQQE